MSSCFHLRQEDAVVNPVTMASMAKSSVQSFHRALERALGKGDPSLSHWIALLSWEYASLLTIYDGLFWVPIPIHAVMKGNLF